MVNRGRFCDTTVEVVTKMINESENIICIFGESDSSDKDISLDGRKVLKDIIKASGRSDYSQITAKNQNVGMNALIFGDMKTEFSAWKCINRNNLKHPQSISERYMHHRMHAKIELGKKLSEDMGVAYINILAQHQSAFVRPLSRFKQAREILKLAHNSDKIDTMTLVARDQNSFLPGEGFLEHQLRKKYGMHDLTHGMKSTYNVMNLENDYGDFAHRFVRTIYSNWIGRIAAKLVTNTDKIESLLVEKEVLDKYDTKAIDVIIPSMDHDLVGVEITKKRE
jgi:hypothetical protein